MYLKIHRSEAYKCAVIKLLLKLTRICRKREAYLGTNSKYSELFLKILLSASFSRTFAVLYTLFYCFSIRAFHLLSTGVACVYRQMDHQYKNNSCHNEQR